MRARHNSTWGGTVSGEWWLTEDGEVEYADQDIGEQGHEAIAIDHLLDRDMLLEGLVKEGIISEADVKELESDDIFASNIFFTIGIPDAVGKAAASSPQVWTDIKKLGAREAFMKHEGAIMAIGEAFTAWRVTEKTIAAIQNFVLEQTDDEPDPSMTLTIERVLPTQKYTMVDWADFQFVKKPSELRWI